MPVSVPPLPAGEARSSHPRLWALVWLGCLPLAGLHAQPSAPVYPSYQGYVANEDGTFTLVFDYYNANPVPVEIPVGPRNRFTPGPEDRGQPIRFLPGRQRSVCRMVVDASFTANLQWTLGFGETTTTTSERGGVDPLYLIERIGPGYRDSRDLDTGSAARGVCSNRAPTVRLGPDRALAAAAELAGFVSDDGLPRHGSLRVSWSQLSGPASAQLGSPEQTATGVEFPVAGVYELRLTASDAELSSSDEITITVEDPPRR